MLPLHLTQNSQQKLSPISFTDGRNGGLLVSKPLKLNETVSFVVKNRALGCPPMGITSLSAPLTAPQDIPIIPDGQRLEVYPTTGQTADYFFLAEGSEIEYLLQRRLCEKDVIRLTLIKARDEIHIQIVVNQIKTVVPIRIFGRKVKECIKMGIRFCVGAFYETDIQLLDPKEVLMSLANNYTCPSPPTSNPPSPVNLSDASSHSSNENKVAKPATQANSAAANDAEGNMINMTCGICLCNVSNRFMHCGHHICLDCVTSIIDINNECPFCSKTITGHFPIFFSN